MTQPTAWEYRVEAAADLEEARLNRLGRDGWELVTTDAAGRAIFKRPGPDYRERISLAQRERVQPPHGPEAG